MARPSRQVMTLAGPVAYLDSGWTTGEWAVIERVMAKCTGVGCAAVPAVAPRAEAAAPSLAPFDRRAVERAVSDALKMTIDAHGPITREWVGSAAKRIVALLKAERRAGRGG
jgi:hypothetical protein